MSEHVNTPSKSPSQRRVVVIAGAWAVLASAVTPVFAEPPRERARFTKKSAAPARSPGGGSGGAFSLERTITAVLRP
ncbi:hypothetical protein [Sphingomonas agri]|uniref:hypothetical protein n=1 Tax=Sphingomonas agri TaxID=1813878 RepID=UPI00311E633E